MAYYTLNYSGSDIDTKLGEIDNKQNKLRSGIDIKTINGESILTSGDIVIPDLSHYYTKAEVNLGLDAKQPLLESGTNIKTINNKTLLGSGNIDVTFVPISWSELRALRENSALVPGTQYRITDYQCTTTQDNTSSAGHQFDIIVVADNVNVLNEKARACLHAGDTYFNSHDLAAWELWYCLDNDTNRFAWADDTNGKGVIYRMIDGFGNDVPYDFKNILFTDDAETPKYTNIYTFTCTKNGIITDASLSGFKSCRNNIIKSYITSSTPQNQRLNFNVFYSTSASSGWTFNIFGKDCRLNTFATGCANNTFGSNCHNNTFELGCANNTFGRDCFNNQFGIGCQGNTFNNFCSYIVFGMSCSYNILRNRCQCITFGDSSSVTKFCYYNIFDNYCAFLYINGNGEGSSANLLKNIHVHPEVTGDSDLNRRIITTDRNLAYSIDYYATGSRTIILD